MFSLSQAGWAAIGGMAVAFIGGGFTLAGVVISVRAQAKPAVAKRDEDPCAQLRADLVEMTEDRNRWRHIAETFMPRRREGDPSPSSHDDCDR